MQEIVVEIGGSSAWGNKDDPGYDGSRRVTCGRATGDLTTVGQARLCGTSREQVAQIQPQPLRKGYGRLTEQLRGVGDRRRWTDGLARFGSRSPRRRILCRQPRASSGRAAGRAATLRELSLKQKAN